jgi:hypothetical protein
LLIVLVAAVALGVVAGQFLARDIAPPKPNTA